MDIFTMEFFEKLVQGQAFGTMLGLIVAYVFYRLAKDEKADRKEAWSKYNLLLSDFLKVTGGNTNSLEKISDTLEDNTKALERNVCKYLEKT